MVYIGLAVFSGVGGVVGYFIRRVLVDVESNKQAVNGRAKQTDFEALKDHVSQFEIDCHKNFVSNDALLQVMGSLDRTIQQLTQAIQHNSKESREGLAALNKRIDDFIRKP
jgi:uncharacterized protein YqeY